ncbi:MAG: hypothetical protein RJB56_1169 [Actinomycetota bacterium]|jgi:predicted nuclease with RNAse H fold
MLIAGVDLAAEPKGTAIAIMDWYAGAAKLVDLRLNVADQTIVEVALKVEKLGIDCAFGWPVEFVEFLLANSRAKPSANAFDGDIEMRRRMAYRETDRQVHNVTGRWPLSVSTDRLGMTALRCAGLLSQIAASGVEVDRAGSGRVVEIYPAASLRIWGIDSTGYRASSEVRASLLETLKHMAPWLDLADYSSMMIDSCDAFDAVIAALATRAAALGKYIAPTESQLEVAQIEGWVALPTSPLAELSQTG